MGDPSCTCKHMGPRRQHCTDAAACVAHSCCLITLSREENVTAQHCSAGRTLQDAAAWGSDSSTGAKKYSESSYNKAKKTLGDQLAASRKTSDSLYDRWAAGSRKPGCSANKPGQLAAAHGPAANLQAAKKAVGACSVAKPRLDTA